MVSSPQTDTLKKKKREREIKRRRWTSREMVTADVRQFFNIYSPPLLLNKFSMLKEIVEDEKKEELRV